MKKIWLNMEFRHALMPFLGLALVTPFVVGAEESNRSWSGFLQSNAEAVPVAVRAASHSVYRLTYPNGDFTIVPLSPASESRLTAKEDPWLIFQYNVCKDQRILNCPIFEGMWIATGFTIRSKRIVSTNLHVVQNWLYRVKEANNEINVKNLTNPIIISRGSEALVSPTSYDGLKTPIGKCTLSFFNPSEGVWSSAYLTGSVAQRVSDYVELTCDTDLPGAPLKIKDGLKDERHFLIGYPRKTSILEKYGGTDSDGQSLLVSSGFIKNPTLSSNLNVVLNIPAGPSSSGSPLLTGEGEVVGILFSGTIEDAAGSLDLASQILQLDTDLMQAIWKVYAQ